MSEIPTNAPSEDVVAIDDLIEFQKGRATGPFWQDNAILTALILLKDMYDERDRLDWLELCCVGAGPTSKQRWMSFGAYPKTMSLREAIDEKRLEE